MLRTAGSGGRDLSGNKRTSKTQSFDQEFESMNLALQLSCTKGLPVRVVRSCKASAAAALAFVMPIIAALFVAFSSLLCTALGRVESRKHVM